ncbi:hypothetical protein OHS33_35850 [Streptomyces sp. NBC_00536]|uniref:hypothetical protein n=1 Tax=Streptomyces sp. NBC_00536 TaxID=2975769 RepID=UPI002E8020D7|nr:hypothetical protein [Streptomyces sp. NBC_00536]WUC83281.1 hypothetical protein OHS33_35850 [Streptomyces sp. NBC_00536]
MRAEAGTAPATHADWLASAPCGPALRAEAADTAAALSWQRRGSATAVRCRPGTDGGALLWSPGLVEAPAPLLSSLEHGCVPGLPVPGTQDALAVSVLVGALALAALGRHGRWDVTPGGAPAPVLPQHTDRAEVLGAVLTAADEAAEDVLAALRGGCPDPVLRAALRRAYVAALAHPQPARSRVALRQAGGAAASVWLLPDLSAAFHGTDAAEVRQVLGEAHHRVGKKALPAPEGRAVARIRRSTHQGRLHRIDRLMAEWAALAAAGGSGTHVGVDIGLLAAALGPARNLTVRDEAVSDGAATVDLWHALRRHGVAGELVGGDRWSSMWLVELSDGAAGALDHDGRCIQVDGSARDVLPSAHRPKDDDPAAVRLAAADDRQRVDWVTPAAADCDGGDLALGFRTRDVFDVDPERAHLVRVCGLLYRRLRPDVDADSYFSDEDIALAIDRLGAGLADGGVLVVGSVTDTADGRRRHTDVDVFQRSRDGRLRHCHRWGRGVGPAVGLTSGVAGADAETDGGWV